MVTERLWQHGETGVASQVVQCSTTYGTRADPLSKDEAVTYERTTSFGKLLFRRKGGEMVALDEEAAKKLTRKS